MIFVSHFMILYNSLEYFYLHMLRIPQKIVNIFTFSLHNFISLAFYFLNKIFTSKSIFPHKKNIFIFFIRSKKGQKPPLNVSRITKRKKYIKIYFFSLIRDASCVFIPQNKKYKY